jgi:6-phosphogluconate dehydrogenase
MDIAMVGLGKMGANMAGRLLQGGHRVVVFDLDRKTIKAAEDKGAEGVRRLADIPAALPPPRAVWLMVPAGEPTEKAIAELAVRLAPKDIIIDGGNSNYRDTLRRAAALRSQGIRFVDVGTSGGIGGASEGYSLMVGGEADAVEAIRPLLATLAPGPDKGWGRVGPAGAGHFVKMVHNGIEYGLMAAYAEGFELLRAKEEFRLDLAAVAEIWRNGSVVRSWLLDLIARALDENPDLSGIAAYVSDSGEGRWTVQEAVDLGVPLPVITLALQQRFRSRISAPFSDKLLAALRAGFGGHDIKKAGTPTDPGGLPPE